MTLDEAREHVGHGVVYRPYARELDSVEQGEITGVSESYVFVRYKGDQHSKATAPARLALLAGDPRSTATGTKRQEDR